MESPYVLKYLTLIDLFTHLKQAWLNPEHILTAEDVTCGNCEQPMSLLLQVKLQLHL